jgi:hypothetical protein
MTGRSGLHYERQEQGDMTCAVHTLNGLLQLQSFSVVDLGEIAMQIEGDETALLGGKKARNDNVGMDGNFNVQVQFILRAQFSQSIEPSPPCRFCSVLSALLMLN